MSSLMGSSKASAAIPRARCLLPIPRYRRTSLSPLPKALRMPHLWLPTKWLSTYRRFPGASANLLRALLANSARPPDPAVDKLLRLGDASVREPLRAMASRTRRSLHLGHKSGCSLLGRYDPLGSFLCLRSPNSTGVSPRPRDRDRST